MLPDREHDGKVQNGPFCSYHGGVRSPSEIKWIVIHDTEGGRVISRQPSAQGVANYGAGPNAQASWHLTVDDGKAIRCLADDVVAYHAYSPANNIGLGVELCGFARWLKPMWYLHQATLKRAAWHCARWCRKYDIPPRWLTDEQIIAHMRGLLTHADVTRVLKKGSHTDPGPNFPKRYFMYLVKRRIKWLEEADL